ncbi:hypothetical protein J7E49_20150 [Variovorax paradoxus]|nr:hypothetical protein [Variovorax paradoxus]
MSDSGVKPLRKRAAARAGQRKFILGCACVGVFMFCGLAANAGSVGYTYDALGRLAAVIYNNGTSTTTITYSYDAAGNRTSVATTSP